MPTESHVVVVAMDAQEAERWRTALQRVPAASRDERASWHVLDSSRPSGGLARWLSLERRFPDMEERAERLERQLREPPFVGPRALDDPQITLVAWRNACHLVQEFVLRELRQHGDVRSVRRLRQIVLVSPTKVRVLRLLLAGAALAAVVQVAGPSIVRALGVSGPWAEAVQALATVLAVLLPLALGVFISDEARRNLGIRMRLDYSVADEAFRRAVVDGARDGPETWPIPTRVLELRGRIPDDEENMTRIAAAVARRAPHPNVYVVELQQTHMRIRPITRDDVEPQVRAQARADRRDIVFDDNEAVIHKMVRFSADSASNASSHLANWTLRHGTFDGFLVACGDYPGNLWTPMDRERDYDRNHSRFAYEFAPLPSRTYELDVRVYGGYTGSEQCAHLHLRSDTYYERVHETVDLSAYETAGWTVVERPRVTFVQEVLPPITPAERHAKRQLVGLSCRCAEQDRTGYEKMDVPVRETAPGVFSWDVEDVRDGGVLEFRYRIERNAHVDIG